MFSANSVFALTREASPSKRLLSHNWSRWFIVDVEVTSSIFQNIRSLLNKVSVRKFKLMPMHRQWTWNIYSLYKFYETPIFRSCKSWDNVWKKLPIFDEIIYVFGQNFLPTDEYHFENDLNIPWAIVNCRTNKVTLFQWVRQWSVLPYKRRIYQTQFSLKKPYAYLI